MGPDVLQTKQNHLGDPKAGTETKVKQRPISELVAGTSQTLVDPPDFFGGQFLSFAAGALGPSETSAFTFFIHIRLFLTAFKDRRQWCFCETSMKWPQIA